MRWEMPTSSGGVFAHLYVWAIGAKKATPADIVACLKANPEACAEVLAACGHTTVEMVIDQRTQAERERDEARARLAEAVLAQQAECSRLQTEVAQLRAERDMPCAHRLEEERLQERVRVLEEALRDIADRKLPLSGGKAHEAVCDMRDTARAALEGIEVE